MQKSFERAKTLAQFIEGAEQNRELWESLYSRAVVGEDVIESTRGLRARRHLLVLAEDWCGDAVNTVPWLARLADVVPERLELRVLGRDANPQLMDAHLSDTGARAIPVVMILDEDFREIGWWGSRPRELQAWFEANGRSLEKTERYRQIRMWYARDRGESALREVLAIAGAPIADRRMSEQLAS